MKTQARIVFLYAVVPFLAVAKPVAAQLNVVATTPELGDIVHQVGGTAVEVTVLARPNEDPHFVDPKPSFIVKLNRADALVEGGAELEVGWLPALLDQARNDKLSEGAPGRIRCAEAVELLEIPTTLDRSKGDVHAAGNPHYLVDPRNAQKVATFIGESLCSLQPSSCEAFRTSARGFAERIENKMVAWEAALSASRGAHLAAHHNTWLYFGKRFGLSIDTFLESSPGIPPSPAHLIKVIGEIRAKRIRAVLVEPYQHRKAAESIAESTGIRVLDVAQFPGGIEGSEGGYIELIDAIVTKLAAALAAGE